MKSCSKKEFESVNKFFEAFNFCKSNQNNTFAIKDGSNYYIGRCRGKKLEEIFLDDGKTIVIHKTGDKCFISSEGSNIFS